jgi:hypothetical protein
MDELPNVENAKYLGTAVFNQNYNHKNLKSRLIYYNFVKTFIIY